MKKGKVNCEKYDKFQNGQCPGDCHIFVDGQVICLKCKRFVSLM